MMHSRKPKPITFRGITYPSQKALARALFENDECMMKTFLARVRKGMDTEIASQKTFIFKCDFCSIEFKTNNIQKKFCSDTCRGKKRARSTEKKEYCKKRYYSNIDSERQNARARQQRLSKEHKKNIRINWRKKQREQLTDWYIKRLLNKEFPDKFNYPSSLIDLKRYQLKLKRQIEESKNEKCN